MHSELSWFDCNPCGHGHYICWRKESFKKGNMILFQSSSNIKFSFEIDMLIFKRYVCSKNSLFFFTRLLQFALHSLTCGLNKDIRDSLVKYIHSYVLSYWKVATLHIIKKSGGPRGLSRSIELCLTYPVSCKITCRLLSVIHRHTQNCPITPTCCFLRDWRYQHPIMWCVYCIIYELRSILLRDMCVS